jgi:hypothetical protein
MTDERASHHYCNTCRYALDRLTIDGEVSYEHTIAGMEAWTGAEHDPVPVPLLELITKRMLCDVCSDPDPVWSYRFVNVKMAYETDDDTTFTENFGQWWAICKKCAIVIERRDVTTLVRRALIPHIARPDVDPIQVGQFMEPVYEKMLTSPFERLPLREVR